MENILKVEALSKEFDGIKILKEINLTVKPGEFVAIMGQSGSGKSTLLYNISGMDRPTTGNVFFGSQNIAMLSDEEICRIRLKKMGFVFQKSHLLKALSIRDNIVLPGFKAKLKSRDNIIKDAEELMIRTGIEQIATHDIKKVSGGQLQRAAICRALINQPAVLFGDEPTGSLNSSASKEIMDIINEINRAGTTIILVTHDPKVAARSNRVIFLADGTITDKIELEKYEEKNFVERENQMIQWLGEQIF